MPLRSARDEELVKSYLENRSESAFRALYRAHTPYLFCLALRMCRGDRQEAEEAVQEGWIRAAQRLAGFRGDSTLRTWLAGIVINCSRERRRHWRHRLADPEPEPRSGPALEPRNSTPAPSPGVRVDLGRLVAALPDGQREVLVLFDVEGYTHQEIAASLGIAPGTSKSRLFEARRALRRSLNEGTELGGPHESTRES
jgi:RNA polymerase sigma-70 factor, ECF subfamily